METVSSLLILGAVILICYVTLRLFSAPIRLALKLLMNAGLGFITLFIFNFFGDFAGLHIGVNFVTALVTGFLGIPGVILLLLLELFF